METLAKAIRKREELVLELRRVERFIELYREFSGASVVGGSPIKLDAKKFRGRPKEAFQWMVRVLESSDRPLSRREIIDACAELGYTIPGIDQESYVGMLAFRNRSMIETLMKGGVPQGYVLRTETAQKQSTQSETEVNETRLEQALK